MTNKTISKNTNNFWISLSDIMTALMVLFMFISLTLSEKMQNFNAVSPAQLTQLVNQKNAIVIDNIEIL